MKILLVISSLSSGGAERVMSIMANYWAEQGWDVTLVTLSAVDADFYPLHTRVKRIGLDLLKPAKNVWHTAANTISRIRLLRSTMRRLSPQVVISFMDVMNIITLAAGLATQIPVIVSERVDPAYAQLGYVRNFLRQKLYPHAAAVVVQTAQVADWAGEFVAQTKIKIINNPVLDIEASTDDGGEFELEGKTLIAIGRLSKQKGFDQLIKAFAQLGDVDWQLLILGEGGQRVPLEHLIAELRMQQRISLVGRVNNVRQYLKKANIFVLSSRFEGFPNALLEAMASGMPVISFDCPSGPSVIIADGNNGLLVPNGNVDALAAAMARLMANEKECARLADNARLVRQRYSIDKIMAEWAQLLEHVQVG